MYTWDYNLDKNWRPTTHTEWEWFLVRKINYGDFIGLKKATVRQYFPVIKNRLDPGKRAMFENFLKND